MINLKKVLSGVVAAAVLAANSAMLTSAATTFDKYDVNHDGVVDSRDVSAISQFLNGNALEPHYERYDANGSLTIDDQDIKCVTAKIQNKNYHSEYYSRKEKRSYDFHSGSNYSVDYTANLTDARDYKKYSYKTKKVSSYTLYPSHNMLMNSKSTSLRSVIGTDDRYEAKDVENTGIVRITIKNKGFGTGFIVGDHVIATSADNVYDAENGTGWYSLTIKRYKRDGSITSNTLTPVEAHIPDDFISSNDNIYNYALITVKEDLSGYIHFALGNSYDVNIVDYAEIPLYVTGCPKYVGNSVVINSQNKLYTGEGRIYSNNYIDNTSQLNYTCDTSYGNSGAPVYTVTRNNIGGTSSYTYTVLGINNDNEDTNSYNVGTLVTKYQTQFYLSNSNINY